MSVPSSELGPPPRTPQAKAAPPWTLGPKWGGTHSLPWEGVGGPNSDEGTESLVLYVYYDPFTVNIELDMFISNILWEHKFYFFFTLQYFFTVHENWDMRTNLDDETYTFLHGSVTHLPF